MNIGIVTLHGRAGGEVKMEVRVPLKCTKHSTFLTSPLEVSGELKSPALLNPLKESRCASDRTAF